MIIRTERLLDKEDGTTVVFDKWELPRLAGWGSVEAASEGLRHRARHADPEPLICGGYETRKPHPCTGFRERVTFWPDPA